MLLGLVVLGGFDLASVLAVVEDSLAGPAKVSGELAEDGELAVRGKTERTEGGGDHDALLVVVGSGDTVIDAQALEGLHATGGLVGKHTADSTLEDLGGVALVVGTTAGVGVALLVEVCVEFDLVPEDYKNKIQTIKRYLMIEMYVVFVVFVFYEDQRSREPRNGQR